jgi:hypothetical protein
MGRLKDRLHGQGSELYGLAKWLWEVYGRERELYRPSRGKGKLCE